MLRRLRSIYGGNIWNTYQLIEKCRQGIVNEANRNITYCASRNLRFRLIKMGSIISMISCKNASVDLDHETGSAISGANSNMSTNATEHFEANICQVGDVPNNGMKAFEVDGSKILITNSNGEIGALGAKCTHYGAPLEKGTLCKGFIRCPFHGACFNLKTGDIEDFPGLDSIPKFEVRIENDKVFVSGKRSQLKSHKRMKTLCKRDVNDDRSFIVVGGGAAGAKCVETLRSEGFTGKLTFISKEKCLPYDRPRLSKFMHQKAEELALRERSFYEEADIELVLGSPLSKLSSKCITLADGSDYSFDKLFLATGGQPRKLTIPGNELNGVFVLRSPTDANEIVEFSKGKNVVIIGSSFIGMEAAAYLSGEDRSNSVTVIGTSSVPFERSLGSVVGSRILKWFEEKGIRFQNSSNVVKLEGSGGNVQKAILQDGSELVAEVVVAGIGVTPSTEYLEDSGVLLTDRKYVIVNERMETNVDGVFCGGDIAQFPLFMHENEPVAIGHWQMAHKHGHVAALNMLDKQVPIISVPFFWTMLFGKSFRYAGYGSFDYVVIQGDIEKFSFIAYYCQGDKVVAVATVGRDPAAAKYADYLRQGKFLTKEQVLEDGEIVMKLPC